MSDRIKVFPGHGGGVDHEAKRTTVEFPFTELAPSAAGVTYTLGQQCQSILERLNPNQIDVVLLHLCAKFGEVQR